jgi:4-alpha-glucanotransferase
MLPDYPHLPKRAGGILLHPTSLPSEYGIGDLGPGAHAWLKWLAKAGCSLWQILPLGPTGYADSPYQSFSAFAGNHLLISPQILLEQGLLSTGELENVPRFSVSQVDFGEVIHWKEELLDRTVARFKSNANSKTLDSFHNFCDAQQEWLDDYALFMVLKREHAGRAWTDWEEGLRDRDERDLKAVSDALPSQIYAQKVRQYLFDTQWFQIKQVAQERGITILGDMPIFVAHDSADVWAHPEFFQLDSEGQPIVVAGVPPDYFSATGQRWGNPLYNWDRIAQDDFNWWVERLRRVLLHVDVIRMDHFRGFEAYWEIPSSEETAIKGRWLPGPGHALLDRLQHALSGLPLIAEDLGVITEEVVALRKAYNLPGMKVMQFGFEGGPDDEFLPHQYEEGFIAYTGTHDNDTTEGWYDAASPAIREFCRLYLSSDGKHIAWDMLNALWASVATWSIVPIQDPLELGSEARMNYPSRTHGNWQWRVTEDQLTDDLATRLLELNERHNRKKRI